MPGTELTRTTGRLPAQRLGMLPTRQYWTGAEMAPARATIAALTTGATTVCISLLALGSPVTTALWTGLAILVALSLGLGLVERWARNRANR